MKVLSDKNSQTMVTFLKESLKQNNAKAQANGFALGGKSGTAPIAKEDGYYERGVDSGTYVGFIGKKTLDISYLLDLISPKTRSLPAILRRRRGFK